MKLFTKICVAFLLAMSTLTVYAEAEHYVYFDGTEFTQPQVWAWVSDKVNCTTATAWPGDNMVKKDGMWYWEVPAGKQVPLEIIIHEGDNKIGGDDLPYKDKFIYHQDGSYSDPALPIITASPASGSIFKDEVAVTLSATLDATIYYTTDGSTPTTSSSVYTEALIFTETTTLKVLAVSGDKQTSKTYTYEKMPEPGEVVPGQNLTTKYYTINPNGQKGTRKTIDMQFDATVPYRIKATKALKNWDASDVVAQGVARDVCQAIYGKHERPIVDSYAIYAAYDDKNLYLGVQLVYTVWDLYGEGKQPVESKPYNMDGRLMWAFDLSPVKQFDGYINGKGAIWNGTTQPGAKFNNGVDAIWIGSTQPGVGTPGLFFATPDGHASYEGAYCKSPRGIKYGFADGLLPSITAIYGQSNFEYNPAVLKGESGFTNVKSQTKDADHTFYEWIFPLSELGITADYIEEFGIGIMFVDIYGSSPVGGTPYDPSYFDNAKKKHTIDVSTSNEKEDEDIITYAPVRIGKLLSAPEGGGTTDVEDVVAEDAPVEYYNLMGVKIAEPVKGQVYIERQGAKVTKKVAY